jgi:hypothetical protein
MKITIQFYLFSNFVYEEENGNSSFFHFRCPSTLNIYCEVFNFINNIIEYTKVQNKFKNLLYFNDKQHKIINYYGLRN